jgi:outer membrane protein OmpA-like peptidoglycan-associated protein
MSHFKTASLLLFFFGLLFISMGYSQDEKTLGTKKVGLVNLKGAIYFLESADEVSYESISGAMPKGYIYTQTLNYPVRSFNEGFPGVTDRYEWFGIVYSGLIEITTPGDYKWKLISDDGSRLWIDDKEIINNDGIHGESVVEGSFLLEKGLHKIKVWFFQGPATELGLQLFVTPPDSLEKIFDLNDFSPSLLKSLKTVDAEVTDEGIKIKLSDKILFDVGKYDLKPSATESIIAISDILKQYPESSVRIEGHTDNVGDETANQRLSENRAAAVMDELSRIGIPAMVKIQTIGYAEKKPVASNDTESGRALNRRVEVIILP